MEIKDLQVKSAQELAGETQADSACLISNEACLIGTACLINK
jgi:hypothetical protein